MSRGHESRSLSWYGVTIRGNVTSVYPPLECVTIERYSIEFKFWNICHPIYFTLCTSSGRQADVLSGCTSSAIFYTLYKFGQTGWPLIWLHLFSYILHFVQVRAERLTSYLATHLQLYFTLCTSSGREADLLSGYTSSAIFYTLYNFGQRGWPLIWLHLFSYILRKTLRKSESVKVFPSFVIISAAK